MLLQILHLLHCHLDNHLAFFFDQLALLLLLVGDGVVKLRMITLEPDRDTWTASRVR